MAFGRFLEPGGSTLRSAGLAAFTLVATGLYFTYLANQNMRAEAYVAALRDRDPVGYLDELRRLEGFHAFLLAYREIEGLGEFTAQPPSFLTGRWTMREERIRVPPNSSFALCPNPLLIDYGRVTLTRGESRTYEASYRLDEDGLLEVRTDTFGTIPFEIVAFGPQINFLEFTPPGAESPVHAYRCTM